MKILLLIYTLFALNFVFSQTTENTITLTTSGTGKTLEEAKNNALRSAIEQAFGTFISSKTEILNDELVSDEITSVASGNVESFKIISQTELPDNNLALTLLSVISVTKLTSYCENKGIQIEFKGSLFATNLKLQKLNEEAELKAILDLYEVSIGILKKSIDFSVKTSEPKQVIGNSDLFEIKYTVECNTNANYYNFEEYFRKSIIGIGMTESEIAEYKKLNKEIFCFDIDWKYSNFYTDKKGRRVESVESGYTIISLRNRQSVITLQNLFNKGNGFITSFKIQNDLEEIFVNVSNDNYSGYKLCNNYNKIECWNINCNIQDGYNQYENKITKTRENRIKGLINFQIYPFDSRYQNSNQIHHFGTLVLNSSAYIENTIIKQYSLDKLSKISFIKIDPLK